MARLCTIDGCGRPYLARGFCSLHYERQRIAAQPACRADGCEKRAEKRGLCGAHYFRWRTQDCIFWPFGMPKKGYPKVNKNSAHRLVCKAAAHSCGKGHLGCINPNHLRWASPKENNADKIAHGTANRGDRCNLAKLSEASVIEIKRLLGAVPNPMLAARFNISVAAINAIASGRTWSYIQVPA